MDELPGALGTSASLALRLGQAIFSIASLLFMCLDIEFYSYSAFCLTKAILGIDNDYVFERHFLEGTYVRQETFVIGANIYVLCARHLLNPFRSEAYRLVFLVTIMGLVIPWSLTLALVDVYSVCYKRTAHQPGLMFVIIVGDWVLSFLSLAAACSTASVGSFLISFSNFCGVNICLRYQLSAAMTFLSWFLSLASSLFNLWLLPSL